MLEAIVIDDNHLPADALCSMLSLLDVNAQPAYGSRAALEVLKETTPDIIFVDINMPGLSGFEVIKFIRREPHLLQSSIIVVTSDDSVQTEIYAQQLGADRVIVKPASYDALESAIQTIK